MSKLDSYNGMVVSKYFKDIEDFIRLEFVCKKYNGNMKKFHFNPIPLTCKTINYFPNIETFHLWDKNEENFGNGFFYNFACNTDYVDYNNINKYFHREIKVEKKFYEIVLWFNVDYCTVEANKSQNFIFKNLKYSINDRKNVTSIGNNSFRECSSLSSVVIPSSVVSIGAKCFEKCRNLSRIDIPHYITVIGFKCLFGNETLGGFDIPPSVKWINDKEYKSDFVYVEYAIPTIQLPIDLNTNPTYAMYPNLAPFINPVGMINPVGNGPTAGNYKPVNDTYEGKNTLIQYNIPSNVISIECCCFYDCSCLSSVIIPSSVVAIGDGCFYRCRNLKSVVIPSSVTAIGSASFRECSTLSSVVIPSSVVSIGAKCFEDCKSLNNIVIPTVTTIGYDCFKSNTVVHRE
ncbi:hypothetical protein EIN_440890 [Entamoeba invadens IP1]|uniref:Leucine rich repeat containing protein BspA family protein n=1 Tax=Entamoeba invadens IP1 TaxID=370355 RepID=A0A0A1TX28_ENTIV|nr:hypothetical protein EIN_440890 [Entamoeba invadens IP1]ELP83905.1 hypothetical protein EIN_440890 [Entamoeba invadens IP1]|eukprot:XP_004183251.1 hypothetical protein EIN_440890 [Entamoeba invadens IP1]